jgi:hypothetical protein
MKTKYLKTYLLALVSSVCATSAFANTCADLPTAAELKKVLQTVASDPNYPGGFHSPLWLTLLDSSGIVCAVVHSLKPTADVSQDLQMSHRVMALHKASTSDSFSDNSGGAVASGQLYTAQQAGGLLEGFTYDSQVNPLAGDYKTFGTPQDPVVGKRVGGFSVLGGGLALFDANKKKVGAIGVSGETGCTSHAVAWKVREALRGGAYTRTNVPWGLSADHDDKLIQDITPTGNYNPNGGPGHSTSGFGHPVCVMNPTDANDGGSIVGN